MNTPEDRFHALQALRFAAAAAVVIFHAAARYAFSHHVLPDTHHYAIFDFFNIGVTVFFALSGFLMARLSEDTTPLRFLVHRVLRIYPPFVVAVGLTVSADLILFGSYPPFRRLAVLTLFPSGPMQYPIGVEWTLVYEVFFYALTAILCLLPTIVARQLAVAAWTLAIIAANELVSRQFTATLPDVRQIAFSYWNFAFIAGMCAWWLRSFTKDRAVVVAIAALVLLTLAAVVDRRQHFLPAYCLGSAGCAALVTFAASPAANEYFGPRSFLVRLGDGSYGIYLMHVPVIVLLYATSGFKGVPTVVVAILLALTIGTLYGLAEFSAYQFLSRRIDRFLSKVFSGTGLYVPQRKHAADAANPEVRAQITADPRPSCPS